VDLRRPISYLSYSMYRIIVLTAIVVVLFSVSITMHTTKAQTYQPVRCRTCDGIQSEHTPECQAYIEAPTLQQVSLTTG